MRGGGSGRKERPARRRGGSEQHGRYSYALLFGNSTPSAPRPGDIHMPLYGSPHSTRASGAPPPPPPGGRGSHGDNRWKAVSEEASQGTALLQHIPMQWTVGISPSGWGRRGGGSSPPPLSLSCKTPPETPARAERKQSSHYPLGSRARLFSRISPCTRNVR